MQLNLRDVAALLRVPERTVDRWIRDDGLPAHEVDGHCRVHKAELLEWAAARGLPVSPDAFADGAAGPATADLSEALRAGGVHHGVTGEDKEAILKAMVDRLPVPASVDRGFVLQVVLAREALASTGIGEGIAIPHVRNPLILGVPQASITLGFLARPIEFGALDGKPVHCLFMLITPSVRVHLLLLSRLSFALSQPTFRRIVLLHGGRDQILESASQIEGNLSRVVAD